MSYFKLAPQAPSLIYILGNFNVKCQGQPRKEKKCKWYTLLIYSKLNFKPQLIKLIIFQFIKNKAFSRVLFKTFSVFTITMRKFLNFRQENLLSAEIFLKRVGGLLTNYLNGRVQKLKQSLWNKNTFSSTHIHIILFLIFTRFIVQIVSCFTMIIFGQLIQPKPGPIDKQKVLFEYYQPFKIQLLLFQGTKGINKATLTFIIPSTTERRTPVSILFFHQSFVQSGESCSHHLNGIVSEAAGWTLLFIKCLH